MTNAASAYGLTVSEDLFDLLLDLLPDLTKDSISVEQGQPSVWGVIALFTVLAGCILAAVAVIAFIRAGIVVPIVVAAIFLAAIILFVYAFYWPI